MVFSWPTVMYGMGCLLAVNRLVGAAFRHRTPSRYEPGSGVFCPCTHGILTVRAGLPRLPAGPAVPPVPAALPVPAVRRVLPVLPVLPVVLPGGGKGPLLGWSVWAGARAPACGPVALLSRFP
ncbi:hypothetical protein GCM10019017_21670 [Streptomyces showdoensis]